MFTETATEVDQPSVSIETLFPDLLEVHFIGRCGFFLLQSIELKLFRLNKFKQSLFCNSWKEQPSFYFKLRSIFEVYLFHW